MARVPTAFQSGFGQGVANHARIPFQSGNAPRGAFGGGTADTLALASGAAKSVEGAFVALQRRNDEARLNELQTEIDKWEFANVSDAQNGAFSRRGDVEGLTEDVLKRFDGDFSGQIEGLSDVAQGRARELIARRANQIGRSVSRHEANEQRNFRASVYDGVRAGGLIASVNNFNDPERLSEEFENVRQVTASRVAMGEMSSQEASAMMQSWRMKQLSDVGDRWVATDVRGARAFLNQNREDLGEGGAVRLDAQIDRETSRLRAAAEAANRQAYDRGKSDLALAINSGEADEAVVEAAYDDGNGWLKPSDRTAFVKAARSRQEQLREEAVLGDILLSGGAIDPGNSTHRGALDRVYVDQGGAAGLLEGNAQSVTDLVDLSSQVGVMPERAETILRGFMTGGTDQQKQLAYDVVARLEEQSPRALDRTFSERDISDAVAFNSRIRRGMTTATALELGRVDNDPTMEASRQLRQTAGAKLAADIGIGDVEEAFDPGVFSIGPDAPEFQPLADQMLVDYRASYQDFFKQHGDEDISKELATQSINRIYGASRATGDNTIMAYPPEKYYSVSGLGATENAEWMQEQLARDVAEFSGITVKQVMTADGEVIGRPATETDALEGRLLLIATPETVGDITAGRDPGYSVLLQDNNGVWATLDQDGAPVTYRFDPSEAVEKRNARLSAERDEFTDHQVDPFAGPPDPVVLPGPFMGSGL